ncbi:MAG TPA: TRAP transporter TatT component family protein [Kofleriaceae bacterium]|nr:TRAP transporter TatT component family protein [Kofleriaceae bacterium]
MRALALARSLPLAGIVAVCATLGCSSWINERAARTTYDVLERSQEAARRLPDVQLAREAMPGGIVQLEAFALAYPHHAGFRQLRAESLCQYATGFVFDDWEDASLTGRTGDAARISARLGPLLAACADASLALLPPAWRDARARGGAAWSALVARATRAEVPALLWIASSDAVQLALDPLRNLARLGPLTETLTRCTQLLPGAHDADGELLLGTLLAGRSRFLPGDDGTRHFEAARRSLGPGGLIADVMYAHGVAVARRDRALFVATLERVLAADVTRWPERRLANELARQKARRYLAAADTLLGAPAQAATP